MKIYTTEEEQIQALQHWFKRYGLIAGIALVICIVLMFGWQYKSSYDADYAAAASSIYDELTNAPDEGTKEALAKKLAQSYESTIYGKLAAIILTNKKVDAKKWQEAHNDYQLLFKKTANWPDLQIIVFENWLRTKLELNQVDAALSELVLLEQNHPDMIQNYPLNFYNLKGDVLAKLQKNSEAVAAYNQAIDAMNANPKMQQQTAKFVNWIELKRNDLLEAKPLA